jgi:hypothetical protein
VENAPMLVTMTMTVSQKKVIDFCCGLSTLLLLGLFSHGHFCGHEFGQESMQEEKKVNVISSPTSSAFSMEKRLPSS